MKHLTSGEDNLRLFHTNVNIETKNISKTYSPPGFKQTVTMGRKVIGKDIQRQNLDLMPGFKLTWYYSGGRVEPEAKYTNPHSYINPYFTRYL